ncbi:MAG: copper chaperone PCu(A)C [Terricaulis sp.]
MASKRRFVHASGKGYVRAMKNLLIIALLAFAAACGAPQTAAPPQPEITTLEVSDGWANPSPGGVDVAAGYLTIANGTDAEERLLSASSPRASRVEIHEMRMDGDVMRMRMLESGLTIPRGETAFFEANGLHLMFIGVAQPFTPGEEIPVTLTFEKAGARDVRLQVRAGGPGH